MNCIVYKADELVPELAAYIKQYMTKPGSEFQKKLDERSVPGAIAVVFGDSGVMGWTRSEQWTDSHGGFWDTLESFVDQKYRGRGIASFAAKGLHASGHMDTGIVAVFDPKMMMVARSAGMFPTLFTRKDSEWVEA